MRDPARTKRDFPRRAARGIVAAALLAVAAPATADSGWNVEFLLGIPFSFGPAVTVRQAGEPELAHRPRFEGRPFDRPIYYAVRIGRWHGAHGWEVELNHDKLYLSNPTREIGHFAISHGFNRVTLNRVSTRGDETWRAGAGVVITHPENTVRERRLPEGGGIFGTGYHVSGPTAMGAVGGRTSHGEGLFLSAEGMGTASWVRVPVADGDADLAVAGLHGLIGTGYGWRSGTSR